jgi:hypothetical protein
MSELRNYRQELFAQALAKGERPLAAYASAKFRPHRQNASRLASSDAIKMRVAELKEQRQTKPPDNGRDPESGRFLTGNGGGGRPKGSRNKLGEQFISDLQAEWEISGTAALKRVVEMDPVAFVKVTASLMPAKVDATVEMNISLFERVRNFREAWDIARQVIGADDDKLIELHRNDDDSDHLDG